MKPKPIPNFPNKLELYKGVFPVDQLSKVSEALADLYALYLNENSPLQKARSDYIEEQRKLASSSQLGTLDHQICTGRANSMEHRLAKRFFTTDKIRRFKQLLQLKIQDQIKSFNGLFLHVDARPEDHLAEVCEKSEIEGIDLWKFFPKSSTFIDLSNDNKQLEVSIRVG